MTDPTTTPPAPTVWPSVGFTDTDAGIRFLTEGLGFTVTACYRGEDGTVEHAEARWPDGGGLMFGSRGHTGPWGALGPQGVYVVAADGWAERFARLDAALLDRLCGDVAPVPPEVREAWRLVHGSAGRCRVEDLAAHVGWSRRHLSEQFRLATGVPPKQAARIARFEATRRLLLDPRRPPLAEVAVRCGYADQPHLAREWRALAGCSVGTWLREELPFVQDGAPVGGAPSPA